VQQPWESFRVAGGERLLSLALMSPCPDWVASTPNS
jgi:hypothetical protein